MGAQTSHDLRSPNTREEAWARLFAPGAINPLEALPAEGQALAYRAAKLILSDHHKYLAAFNLFTAKAREDFEDRDWKQGTADAAGRVQLYREAVHETWGQMLHLFAAEWLSQRGFWMAARRVFLECVFDEYDADVALTYFYSIMRIAFDSQDAPVEYADDGLAERSHVQSPQQVWKDYPAGPEHLCRSVERLLEDCSFRARFEDRARDASLVAARLMEEWRRQAGTGDPHVLEMLRPIFFRDQEAYLAGMLLAPERELPVVFALRHEETGITVDAVLAGKEDMRNILFVSTRSTFHVRTDGYREVLRFLDSMAPERGHPAMCAVFGFTHPARVALNQRVRRHLSETGERFTPAPGRVGMAMIVFSPPSFPYVFKVVRDFSSKQGWMGRGHIMELYRWVHEMNRGRLMLDAWLYRNLHFPRRCFDEEVVQELLRSAPSSVRLDGDTVVLKHVYAQRRVTPLNTFFDQTVDPALRERAIDALGTFIKDLAGMGFFVGDCYGLPSNTGLTHGFNVTLFDFDDLGPIDRYQFKETPPMADERDEFLWNSETDGAWFSVGENDVLVDEWERFLGVPTDLKEYFRQRHGDLFSAAYWENVQRGVREGKLHFVVPYPPERRLVKSV